jgi:hypothetical protein
VAKKLTLVFVLVVAACLQPALACAAASEQPLTQDDVTLLLLGGSTANKMIPLIEQRGIDFQMNPDLAKKFHDSGASDQIIEALQKASVKTNAVAAAAATTSPPTAQPGSQPAASAAASPPAVPKPTRGNGLTDPSPGQIQEIIQEFATKEKLFKEARNNYVYHQINKVQELGPDGDVVGVYEQEWDILYDDSGKRIERVTYAPQDTLKRIGITKEDLSSMRSIQPFVLTSDELVDYDVKYLGHVKVDEITAYVFSTRPKEIKKGRQYFQGTVWVDDRDLQIVKSEGKPVPEMKTKNGENLFPRFTTYREQIDGKFWFPTYTMADDTLYFSTGQVHIKQVIRYTDYKQFKSKVRIVSVDPTTQPNAAPPPPPPPKQ